MKKSVPEPCNISMTALRYVAYQDQWCSAIHTYRNATGVSAMIALFVLGLAAVAVGPMLALLTDDAAPSTADTGSAGMFVALNDNARSEARRAA
jgi:hypothetical protein